MAHYQGIDAMLPRSPQCAAQHPWGQRWGDPCAEVTWHPSFGNSAARAGCCRHVPVDAPSPSLPGTSQASITSLCPGPCNQHPGPSLLLLLARISAKAEQPPCSCSQLGCMAAPSGEFGRKYSCSSNLPAWRKAGALLLSFAQFLITADFCFLILCREHRA